MERARRIPRPVRSAAGATLGRLPSSFWNNVRQFLPGKAPPHFGAKMQKAVQMLGSADSFDDVYRSYLDEWSSRPELAGAWR